MVRIIYYLVAFLATTTVAVAQSNYEKGMQKALTLWQEQKPVEAANLFERIAKAEKDEWLPYYYVSQINTIASFNQKDKEQVTLLLTKAQDFLNEATTLSPENAEILIQQAFINTAWIAFDGATYGMTLSGKNAALYSKALALAPNNPRVVLSKAEWDMGSARYFGQDTAPFCKDVERALELFATFKTESDLHPRWGEKRAKEILASCKE